MTKIVVKMIKLCHISKISMHVLLFLFFDLSNRAWTAMQGPIHQKKVISRTLESFQVLIVLKSKNQTSKLKFFCKMPVIYIIERPFRKTSCCKCTPNLVFVSSYLRCLVVGFKMLCVCNLNKRSTNGTSTSKVPIFYCSVPALSQKVVLFSDTPYHVIRFLISWS